MTKGKRSISQRYEPNVVKNPYQGVKRSFRAGIARFHVQLVLCINLALLYIKMKFSRSWEDYNSFS